MTIGIDLNEVLRNFTTNFAKYYKQGYDHTFDYDDFEMWSHDIQSIFKFASTMAYEKFTFEDYAYELFGACSTCEMRLSAIFNDWVTKSIPDINTDENIELVMVAPREYNLAIPSTMFFLSKIGCRVRNIKFPKNPNEVWDFCDAVITANPDILMSKPDDKHISVRIECEYNKDCDFDFTSSDFKHFAESNITEEIIKKYGER